MHYRIRRALSLLFLLLFLLAAPALIISTSGYRYNFLKGRIERTGVLFVSSKPSNARIFLSNGDTEKKTPNRVRRILPGTYDVTLEKEGYHSWEKTIDITSRQTTFLNNILLFRNEVPESIFNLPVSDVEISPNHKYAAVQTSTPSHTELRVVDLRSGKTNFPYRTENATGASIKVTWSPDSSRFFIKRENGGRPTFFLWNNATPDEMTNLIEIAPKLYDDAFWSQEGLFLHATADNRLYAIDVQNYSSVETGLATQSMRIIDSTVYGVFKDASGTTLVRRGLQDDTFEVMGKIPDGNYQQVLGNPDRIALHDISQSTLILIDPSSQSNGLTYHELRVEEVDWSKDGVLLYRNGFELHIFNPTNGIDRLVTRLGGNLGTARWYPANGLVLYSNGQELIMTQASSESEKRETILAQFTQLSGITINKDGTRAWLIGELDGQKGLWTLRLR